MKTVYWLRAEGLVAFLLSTTLFFLLGGGAWWFVALFFVVDITMLGYIANPRVGAWVYNIGHSYALPLMFILLGVLLVIDVMVLVGLLWCAHIGFDRALGYGLKKISFRTTHLGRIGR